jgi:hypothetical protein
VNPLGGRDDRGGVPLGDVELGQPAVEQQVAGRSQVARAGSAGTSSTWGSGVSCSFR